MRSRERGELAAIEIEKCEVARIKPYGLIEDPIDNLAYARPLIDPDFQARDGFRRSQVDLKLGRICTAWADAINASLNSDGPIAVCSREEFLECKAEIDYKASRFVTSHIGLLKETSLEASGDAVYAL